MSTTRLTKRFPTIHDLAIVATVIVATTIVAMPQYRRLGAAPLQVEDSGIQAAPA